MIRKFYASTTSSLSYRTVTSAHSQVKLELGGGRRLSGGALAYGPMF